MTDEKKDLRPWWKWKSGIGSVLSGLAVAIIALPDFPIFSVNGTVFTSHAIGGCIGGIGLALGGVGFAAKLQKSTAVK